MTAETYVIKTLVDLLKVPADRRSALFESIEQGLLVYDFYAGDAKPEQPFVFTWTDDGCLDTTLTDLAGETLLELVVTKDCAEPTTPDTAEAAAIRGLRNVIQADTFGHKEAK